MVVIDVNPYSKYFEKITEAVVSFSYKGYNVCIETNGTGCLEFEGAEQHFKIVDAFDKKWSGKGCVEDAINFIHNMEKMKE